jgi:hypothetical protein
MFEPTILIAMPELLGDALMVAAALAFFAVALLIVDLLERV